jgi:hypothetical protein
VTCGWRKARDEGLHNPYPSLQVTALNSSKCTCEGCTGISSFELKEFKRPFGRPRRRWEDNVIRMLDNWTVKDLGFDIEENTESRLPVRHEKLPS